jgi:hypothetical protein
MDRGFGPAVRSGALRMFVAPDEVEDCLQSLRAERELSLLVSVFADRSLRVLGPGERFEARQPIDTVAICDELLEPIEISWTNFRGLPYERGWLSLDLWLGDSSVLNMATLSYKSAVVTAPALFSSVKKRFSRFLRRGVEVENINYEGSRGPWKDAYFSAGAKELAGRGVLWKQSGIDTQRYYPGS